MSDPDSIKTDEAEAWRRGWQAAMARAAKLRWAEQPTPDLADEGDVIRVYVNEGDWIALTSGLIPIPAPPRDLTAEGLCERGA